jgi:hypothetical protein
LLHAQAGMLCLALIGGHAASSTAQSYEGYPVFWGNRNSLQRSSEVRGTRADANSIEKVGYTERQTASGVVYEKASPEMIVEGDVIHEGEVMAGGQYGGGCDDCGCGDAAACGGGCGSGGDCGTCDSGCGTCGGGGCIEDIFHTLLSRAELSAGVQAYKGPLDDGENGNFGFQQGFNLGFPLIPSYGIGAQFGANFTQSDLSGYEVQNFETDDARTQQFITVGIFERATDCCPLQWGVVFDWMSDDIAEDLELNQLRGEIGYLYSPTGELGFWFTASDDSDYSGRYGSFRATVEPTDMYAFYYRHTTCEGNELRMWGGFTDNSDGLFGADFQVPISDRFAIRGAANYLIPNEESGHDGAEEESWGLGFSLVWYPGCRARCVSSDLFSPLLRVADDSTFMVDHADVDR